jgi:hypothetical protein
MADSVTPANLPAGFDLYGAYVDGVYKNYAQVDAMYPGRVVGIAVFPTTDDGIVGDCETGDMTPQTAVIWVRARRVMGVDPTIYCSAAIWQQVRDAFDAADIDQPHYWIAAYPGIGPELYPGSVAHQWIDHGPYDESVVADYWPGVDPPPQPPDNLKEGETMTSIIIGGQLHVFGVIGTTAWHWWQETGPPASAWHSEQLPS